jgi:peptidoglycan/xylan/chitin deacetylase (PgdA/CDA1 family)
MKRYVKLVVSLVWWSGGRLAGSIGGKKDERLTILYYHAVRPEQAAAFQRQVRMAKASAVPERADYLAPPDGTRRVAMTFDDAFMSVVDHALPILAAEQFPCTIFAPAGQLGAHPAWEMEGSAPDREELIATAAVLRGLPKALVDIGAHSVSHPRLTRIPLEQARQEVQTAKASLEDDTGRKIESFAFPYGDYNADTLQLCEEAGYRFAYSIGPGSVETSDANVLRPRVAADPDDPPLVFWLKLRGGYEWMPFASRLKQGLRRAAR